MQNTLKKSAALLLIAVLIFSFTVTVFGANGTQPTTYSKSRNSGERHVVATTLDGTSASSYYTSGYDYNTLSQLSKSDLLTSLRTLMKSTHKKSTSYSDCKNYSDETDCENENSSIITIYTSYESSQTEYNSGSGWNREHVWPKSLGGFETSGAGADLHHIRPSENKTNSDRGSKLYGNVTGGTASKGNLSSLVGGHYAGNYYEPLDNVKGDVARICLYVYVRYGGELSKCSNITNVFKSVDVLLEWCELDPVDTWELGRNEVVGAIQGNRNVFIDYPEYAWLIFGKEVPEDMQTPSGMAMAAGDCDHTNTELKNVAGVSCTANGYTGDTVCKDCGKTVVRGTVITTNGHSYGDWVIVEEATVNGPGKKTKTCSVCQNVLTEVIEQLPPPQCDHPGTEILNYKKSTCSETGYSGDKCCTECGLILEKGKTILSVAHTYGEWEITKEPTATEVGQKKASCTVCGKSKTDFIPTLPPCDHSETEIRDAANADCGNNGYSGDTYCTLCGELVSNGTETSPSGEHIYGEWEVLQFATPDKFGKQIRKCEVCDHIESSVLVYVEPDNTNTVAIVIISASAGVALFATAAVIVIVKRKKQH